ncbi:DUF3000 domain-containing protein [Janibacter terrae]|uniref:DUF3000 domain-containing protein n=1 Tax=Janibacter terrae TaxID=103817 RepID=UPI0008394D70|nr:DUF3000 domain-containing protein [Janibacter terrae]
MATREISDAPSPDFARALRSLHETRLRPEVRLTEVPAPTRLAPDAVAMTADIVDSEDGEDLATGRFVLLHDPAEPEPWGGSWRVVTFARAELEAEVAGDPMLGAVGWSWLTDALEAHGIGDANLAGTVTHVVSESFGDLEDREVGVEMEIRASWSPADASVGTHLLAWIDMLATVGGLPPLPPGVVALPGRRR